MLKEKIKVRKVVNSFIIVLFCSLIFIGCSKPDTGETIKTNTVEDTGKENNKKQDVDIISQEKVTEEDKKAFSESSATNDTDLGLKNIKIDLAQSNLTEEQQLVIKYFSRDYMFVNSIESFQRYPNIFDNSLIECYVSVAKVLKYDSDSYELLVYLIQSSNEYEEDYQIEERYMVIKGKSSDTRYIQGDIILMEGRYVGVDTYDVDGTSLVIPTLNVHTGYILDKNDPYYYEPSRMNMKEVKQVAKCVFGEDITISNPDPNIDVMDSIAPYYVCTLDNQSTAKFSKYYFHERSGTIEDAGNYNRQLEFAADFEHFFLFSYDYDLETLTLEYYDNSLNKLWKREFEDTTSASYDYTKNNVYLTANNSLYVIDINTGEDTYTPTYIGNKREVRKLKDGILTISGNKSDGIIKTDLEGNIQWRLNLTNDANFVLGVQIIDDKIVVKLILGEYYEDYSEHYIVIDNEDGTLIQDASIDYVAFHQYS